MDVVGVVVWWMLSVLRVWWCGGCGVVSMVVGDHGNVHQTQIARVVMTNCSRQRSDFLSNYIRGYFKSHECVEVWTRNCIQLVQLSCARHADFSRQISIILNTSHFYQTVRRFPVEPLTARRPTYLSNTRLLAVSCTTDAARTHDTCHRSTDDILPTSLL